MNYYIVKDNAILSTISGPVNEDDLATRGETMLATEKVYEPGWVKKGSGFVAPTLPVQEQIVEAVDLVHTRHAEFLRNLTGNATIEERDTWQAKALAAEAIQAGTASAIQQEMIATEASVVGETEEQLVQTILAKYGAYQKLIGLASGLRRKTEAALSAASNKEEIDQVLAASDEQSKQFVQQWQSGG